MFSLVVWFCKSCFSSKNVLIKHKEVKLEKPTVECENYSKQIPVPVKSYAGFECNLRGVESYEGSYTESIKTTFLVVLLTKLLALMIGLLS